MVNTSADWLICHEILVALFIFEGSREQGSGATHRNPNSRVALIRYSRTGNSLDHLTELG
jgi:hypothetical protein